MLFRKALCSAGFSPFRRDPFRRNPVAKRRPRFYSESKEGGLGFASPGTSSQRSLQAEACTTNVQQAKACTTNVQQVEACTTKVQQAEACTTKVQQAEACTTNVRRGKACTTNVERAEARTTNGGGGAADYLARWLQLAASHRRTSTRRPDRIGDRRGPGFPGTAACWPAGGRGSRRPRSAQGDSSTPARRRCPPTRPGFSLVGFREDQGGRVSALSPGRQQPCAGFDAWAAGGGRSGIARAGGACLGPFVTQGRDRGGYPRTARRSAAGS